MSKICQPTEVPQVDNSDVKCEGQLRSTDCSVYEDAISYLGLPANSSLTDVLNAMLSSLIDARNRIQTLETT